MKLVLDTNVLLSALIKDSATRMIIVKSGWDFYYPEISLHEIRKYKALVLEKSGISEEEYTTLLNLIFEHIVLVPDEKIHQHLKEAKDIMLVIDPDDVVFIAAQLGIPDSIIWSDDSHFDRQSKVKTLKSQQVFTLFTST